MPHWGLQASRGDRAARQPERKPCIFTTGRDERAPNRYAPSRRYRILPRQDQSRDGRACDPDRGNEGSANASRDVLASIRGLPLMRQTHRHSVDAISDLYDNPEGGLSDMRSARRIRCESLRRGPTYYGRHRSQRTYLRQLAMRWEGGRRRELLPQMSERRGSA